jgi:hypothetical protein
MPSEATDPKEKTGTWWTSLPGIITALAALLTAITGLVVALNQVGLFSHGDHAQPRPEPPIVTPPPLVSPPIRGPTVKVDGVTVMVLSVRRTRDDGSFVDVGYSVTPGPEYVRHDPANFVRLIASGSAIAPVWTSAPAQDLPAGSTAFGVKFRAPPGLAQKIVLRFGEAHPVDLSTKITE